MHRLQARLDQAHAAYEFVDQCRRRAGLLIAHANLLIARFDELEHKTLFRMAELKQSRGGAKSRGGLSVALSASSKTRVNRQPRAERHPESD